GEVRETVERTFHTPGLEGDVLTLDVAQLAQTLTEGLAKQGIGDKLTDACTAAGLLRLGDNPREGKQDERDAAESTHLRAVPTSGGQAQIVVELMCTRRVVIGRTVLFICPTPVSAAPPRLGPRLAPIPGDAPAHT